MNYILVSIYFLTIILVLFTYVIYPLTISILARIFSFKVKKGDTLPSVSVVISAYNEEKHIDQKIQNTLALNYPMGKMEILVGSDGSTDNTSEVLHHYIDRGIQVTNFRENRGKTAVQNDLVQRSKGEILIFTDASSFLPRDALKNIVRSFHDERVGCVAGRMRFIGTDSNLNTQSQGLYWKYEVRIREMESKLGSVIGVDGPLYAVRRACYIPLEDHVISDLITPLLVLEQGKKVVLENESLVDEVPTHKALHEFTTRRRITLRGLVGIATYGRLLNPLRQPLLAFQLFFHKVLRWFVGPLVILNIVACLVLLGHRIFDLVLAAYLLFFFLAALGWAAESAGTKARILTIPYYFCLVNFAATMGIIDFLRKKQAISWKPVREQ